MFVRLVYESFRRQPRRKLLVGVAVALGAAVATAMIAIATDIGDKISRELRTLGANIVVTPEDQGLEVRIGSVDLKPAASYLNEADLAKIKGIFWRNNIVAFTPLLRVNVAATSGQASVLGTYFEKTLQYGNQSFTTGARKTFPWWTVRGDWPKDDSNQVLVGETLASKMGLGIGSSLTLSGHPYPVTGVLRSGGVEDDEIIAPLSVAQDLLGKPGAVEKIFVSAVTKPEDAFARRNPDSLNPADRDRWYCSPYARSIAYQLQEALPHSHAEQIRQVSQNEGTVLARIEGLMLLITLAALLTSGLAVAAAMATAMFERREEVGLMKALGAGHFSLSAIFVTESVLLACAGAVAGFAAGALLARELGQAIFGSSIAVQPVLLPVVIAIAVAVTFAGSAAAIRRAVKSDPVHALRGDA